MGFKKIENLIKFKNVYVNYKKTITVLIVIMLLASSLSMLLPYFVSERLVSLTNVQANEMVKLTTIILTIVFIHHIFCHLWARFDFIISNKVSKDIRKNIIKKIFDTKYEVIKHKASSYYLERLTNDTEQVASVLGSVLGTMVDCCQ